MAAPRPWTVLPHGPLEPLEENLRAVTGSLPGSPMARRMAVVRLGDRRLVFHNAIPLDEPAMQALAAWGRPAFLVVPNRFHRLDVHAFRERHPGLAVLCPAAARPHVEKVVRVDGGLDLLPRDPGLEAVPLEGARAGEAALLVRSPGGRATLAFGDAVMNVAHRPGLMGLLLRLLGTSGGPKVTPVFRRLAVSDRRALAGHLSRLAATPGLSRLLVSHGEDVTSAAPAVLQAVAAALR
ncbi:MAG: hypothetical protein HZB56_01525 [Deltaproteobacteria bacterium]|nr:hypothetical protein [Deltaproteobacteria bacterium]